MIADLLFLALGVAMILRGDIFAKRAIRRHDNRLAELKAGDEERFFEERRSLNAYPPFAKPRTWRIIGGLLVAVMLSTLLTHSL